MAPVNVISGDAALRQTVVVPETLAVGSGLTVTVVEAVAVQPKPFVTVTVYVVVAVGLTPVGLCVFDV